jgi:hypothetical protein
MENATDPVVLLLLDGEKRKFLLSHAGFRRLKTKFGVKSLVDLFKKDEEESAFAILYEALLEKQGMTEDQFAELLPSHPKVIAETVSQLFGASLPDPPNPQNPAPGNQTTNQ